MTPILTMLGAKLSREGILRKAHRQQVVIIIAAAGRAAGGLPTGVGPGSLALVLLGAIAPPPLLCLVPEAVSGQGGSMRAAL